MTRKKKVLHEGIGLSEAQAAFAQYAQLSAKERKINAIIDLAITEIRKKHDKELATLIQDKESAFEKIQAYALANPETFGGKKSQEWTHGVFGFRTGTPKLKLLKGFTWASVTNLLKKFLPEYIRTSEEPAKDRLLADRATPEVATQLNNVGIVVHQDETFFIELKTEQENL